MAWLEITIRTPAGQTEEVAAALTAHGFSEFSIEDQQEFEEFLEENRNYWDYIDENLQQKLQGLSQIKLYLPDTDASGLARLEAMGLPMQTATLPDTDWENDWRDSYPPQPVGQTLVVLPYWLADDYDTTRRRVILDPGLTFGTGAHASTQMVMEAMETLVTPATRCLDLGSGSGILCLTALALGAQSAIGVDVDPKAEDIARENAAYNGFTGFTALTGDVTRDRALMEQLGGTYSLVLVNIVADVIIALAPTLPRFLGHDSVLICSGILDTRLPDVLAALEKAGLRIVEIRQKEDWRCVLARKGGVVCA